jgi:hypothetical protein
MLTLDKETKPAYVRILPKKNTSEIAKIRVVEFCKQVHTTPSYVAFSSYEEMINELL